MSAPEWPTDELDREDYKVRCSFVHCYVHIITYVLR